MFTLLAQYWPILLGGLLIAAGIVLWSKRIRRVDFKDSAEGPKPTLARNAPPAPPPGPEAIPDFLRIAPMAGEPDNLLLIKGLGPRIAMMLNGLGVTRFEQIARLTPTEQEQLDRHLGPFKGRMTQDRWIDQARILASGDRGAFEAEFGSIDGASS